MTDPLISILMPVKNAAPFIKECLDSVLDQTYTHWELIAVNDHSTDESAQILTSYSEVDKRIRVVENVGQGIIPALQTAYKESSGELITRMDADDVMALNKLSEMARQLEHHGKGFIATGCVRYFSEGELGEGFKNYAKWLNELTQKGENFSEIYKECVIPSPCWMVYREDFERCGAFDTSIYPEDYDLAFRFYKQGLKVIPTHQVFHHWRDYEKRTSRTDDNYADNSFIALKCHYFLELDYDVNRQLVIWGAGWRGKKVAKYLLKANIPFLWICNNKRKIGKFIYGIEMKSFECLENLSDNQFILTMSNSEDQASVTETLNAYGLKKMKDYFFWV